MRAIMASKNRVVIGYSNDEARQSLWKNYADEKHVAIKFTEEGKLFACIEMNRWPDIFLYNN